MNDEYSHAASSLFAPWMLSVGGSGNLSTRGYRMQKHRKNAVCCATSSDRSLRLTATSGERSRVASLPYVIWMRCVCGLVHFGKANPKRLRFIGLYRL